MDQETRSFLDRHDDSWLELTRASRLLHYRRTKLGEKGLLEEEQRLTGELGKLVNAQKYIEAVIANTDDPDPEVRKEMALRRGDLPTKAVAYDPEYSPIKKANETALTTLRYSVAGKELTITDIINVLDADPDRAKRELHWRAALSLDETIVNSLREQVKAANAAAKRVAERFGISGIETYMDLVYLDDGFTGQELSGLCNALIRKAKSQTPGILSKVAAAIKIDKIMPWDFYYGQNNYSPALLANLQANSPVAVGEATLQQFGCEQLLDFVDIIGSKTHGAWCYTFHLPNREFKVVMNPEHGVNFYLAFFHEIGRLLHQWHLADVQRPLPFMMQLGDFNTALATTLSLLVYDRKWLNDVLKTEQDTAEKIQELEAFRLYLAANHAIMAMFEDQLYRSPEGDLAGFYQDAARVFNLWPELGRLNNWQMAIAHFVQNAGSLHRYPLGYIIGSGLRDHLVSEHGSLYTPATPALFRRLAEHGARVPYLEKIKNVTGKELHEMLQ